MTAAIDSPVSRPMTFEPLDTQSVHDVGRLLLTCEDQPGICAAVCGHLYRAGANITNLQQHTTDPHGGWLFLRVEFLLEQVLDRQPEISEAIASLAEQYDMTWRLSCAANTKRIAIMVSKADHALQELLWRRESGDLHADIALVISNHDDLRHLAETRGIPFHHIPITADTKAEAEQQQLELIRGNVDTIVLARYMQVLSPKFLAEFPMQAINIHHSFLPAFVGADPYARAAQRGVKLIGATAHYVTEEVDAGPIIEQDVTRIDHRHSVADLRRRGRYVERAVLARAVAWHVEDRVVVHGNQTIVFM